MLRCLAGLHSVCDGFVRLNGELWQDDKAGVFVPTHERGVGYVSQETDLFPHLTVHENLHYAQRRAPQNDRAIKRSDAVDWLGLDGLLDRDVSGLSGGERQRTAIARALLVNPTLLLMDEPIAALDEPARRDVLSYLEPVLARVSLPVVYVSHSLTEVTRLSEHLVWIADGSIREAEPVLLARITKKSRNKLNLEPGSNVFARVKSVAVVD